MIIISQYYCFFCIFGHLNAEHKTLLNTLNIINLTDHKLLNGSVCTTFLLLNKHEQKK